MPKVIDKKQFEKDYNKYNVDEVARRWDISVPSIYNILKREGIKKKGNSKNKKIICN